VNKFGAKDYEKVFFSQVIFCGDSGMPTKLDSTRVALILLHGAHIRPYNSLPPLHALAFAMGTHVWLGRPVEPAPAGADTVGCAYLTMPEELVQRVVASVSWKSWRG